MKYDLNDLLNIGEVLSVKKKYDNSDLTYGEIVTILYKNGLKVTISTIRNAFLIEYNLNSKTTTAIESNIIKTINEVRRKYNSI